MSHRKFWTPEDEARAWELRKQGFTYLDIGLELDRTAQAVNNFFRRGGESSKRLHPPENGKAGPPPDTDTGEDPYWEDKLQIDQRFQLLLEAAGGVRHTDATPGTRFPKAYRGGNAPVSKDELK